MQTRSILLSDNAWVRLLTDGGSFVLSDVSADIHFALSTASSPAALHPHSLPAHTLNGLTAFSGIPTGTKAYIKSAHGPQRVVVSQ